MKRNLITLIGAVAIVAGVIAFNTRFASQREQIAAEALGLNEETPEANEDAEAEAAAPEDAAATESAESPAEGALAPYNVKFETSKGDFVIEVDPSLAPLGAAQFKEIITSGAYNDARFFRVVPDFVVQWGIPGDPKLAAEWNRKNIKDEPVKASNVKGTITYAKSNLPNSRSSQVFINLANNSRLDAMGFSPFGKVIEGMDVVESITAEYGETPNQGRIQTEGNAYLIANFPNLDYIKTATIIEESGAAADSEG